MSEETKLSKKVAKIVSVGKTKLGQYDAIQIKHTQPKEEDTSKVVNTNVFLNALQENQTLAKQIKELKEGDVVGFIKTKKGYNYNLTSIVEASEVPEKEKRPTWNKGGGTRAFNEAAPKVGGVLHDAVALALGTTKDKTTMTDVTTWAEELLFLSNTLEKSWNAGKYRGTQSGTKSGPSQETTDTMAEVSDDVFDLDDF